jgi:hypothetical protein
MIREVYVRLTIPVLRSSERVSNGKFRDFHVSTRLSPRCQDSASSPGPMTPSAFAVRRSTRPYTLTVEAHLEHPLLKIPRGHGITVFLGRRLLTSLSFPAFDLGRNSSNSVDRLSSSKGVCDATPPPGDGETPGDGEAPGSGGLSGLTASIVIVEVWTRLRVSDAGVGQGERFPLPPEAAERLQL